MWNSMIHVAPMATRICERLDKAGVFNIILLFFSSLVIYQIGKTIIKKFQVGFSSSQEEITFSLGLGLGVIIYITFFLGVVGLLYGWIFRLLLLCLGVLFSKNIIVSLKSLLPYLTKLKKPLKPKSPMGGSVFKLSLYGLLAFYAVIYLVAALSPEVEYDSLNYHLGILRIYLSKHWIIAVPANLCSNYPFGMEMIFLFGWLIKDVYMANLFHFFSGLLLVFALYAFGKRYFSPPVGLLAGVIFYTAPIVGIESKSALVELGQAYVTFLAIYAILNWYFSEGDGWLYLSGVFFGLALSVKYTSINYLIIVLPIIVHKVLGRRFNFLKLRESAQKVFMLMIISFIVFLPWLVKNYIFTHNPTFPFLNKVFPNPFMSAELEENGIQSTYLYSYCFGEKNLANYLKLIWDTAVVGKCSGMIGPLFLLFLPITLFIKRSDTVTRWLIFIVWSSSVIWVLQTSQVRYLLPTLPLLSIPISLAIYSLKQNLPFLRVTFSFLINVSLLSLFILQTPFLIGRWHRNWIFRLQQVPFSVVWGGESRESYISKYLPSFEAFQYINENLPKDAQIFALNDPYQAFTDRVLTEPNHSQMGRDLTELLVASFSDLRFKKVSLNVAENHDKFRWVKIKRPGPDPDRWYIHDLRVFERGEAAPVEIARSRWRATSNRYLTRVNYAFDTNILTYWSTEPQQKGDPYFILDLGEFYDIEKVLYITRESDRETRHQLEFSKDNKTWKAVDFGVVLEDEPIHDDLFTEALREIKRKGFNYIFFHGSESYGGFYPLLKSIQLHAKDSELHLLFNRNENFLYEIRVDSQ